MRLKIRHHTVYTYDEPVRSALHILRLTPRNADSQFVKRWRIEIDGDARLDRGEDAHGNITHTVFVEGPLDRVRVSVDGEVDTADANGIMRGTVERLPLPLFLRETALTHADPAVVAFAADVLAGEKGDRLAAMHAMMQRLHADIEPTDSEPRFEGSVKATFSEKAGTAHDVAHVMIAAARSLGIPARFVTGYLFDDEKAERNAAHAWIEASIDRIGWIGFDAANGVCVTDRYVRVASGLDFLDAAPIRGARIGGGSEELEISVQIEQGRQVVEG